MAAEVSVINNVIKNNGGRNDSEMIIGCTRDLFTVNDNFIIFLQIILLPCLHDLFVMDGDTILQNCLSQLEQFFFFFFFFFSM